MPLLSNNSQRPQDIRVFIRDKHGQYLTHGPTDWCFTEDRSKAAVFASLADRVAEQIERIRRTQGIDLGEDPVPLDEIYEACDRCKELVMPFMIHFDGKHFLCKDCRNLARPRRRTG